MVLTAVATTLTVLAAACLGRAVRNFDRKMVAAGRARKAETAAALAAAARAGRPGRLTAIRAPDGSVHYAVQLDGDETIYHLAFEQPDASGTSVTFRLLPGSPALPGTALS